MKTWTDQYFGSLYGEIYRRYLMPQSRARQEAKFAAELLKLKGKTVLDLAAGYGRHARLLARSAHVVALDRNGGYLHQAREGLTGKAALQLWLLQADMRVLPHRDGAFDAVVLLFNSFGYFVDAPQPAAAEPAQAQGQVWKLPQIFYERGLVSEDFGKARVSPDRGTQAPMPGAATGQGAESQIKATPDDNLQVLREIARVLKPGGELLFEAPNPRSLIELVHQHPRRHVVTGSYEIEEEYAWDATRQVLTNRTRFRMGDREESAQFHLRLYSPRELRSMLSTAGLRVIAAYSDYAATPFSPRTSEMQLLHCIRKKH